MGDLHVVHHAAADEPDLPPDQRGNVHHLLDALDRAGEAGNQHFARRRAAKLFQARPHGALGRRVSRPLDVGAVAEKRQHAFLAVRRKRVQIERLPVDWRRIHLVVAGVNDHARRRAYRQRHAIDRAVRDVDVFDAEASDLRAIAGLHFAQVGRIQQPVFLQPLAHQRQRESGAVDRHVQVAQDVGQGADVIFVPVRQHDGAHPIAILLEVGDVRNDDVHAEQFGFRKHHPGIDDDDVVAAAQHEHVHAELAQPAERNSPQRRFTQSYEAPSEAFILSHAQRPSTCSLSLQKRRFLALRQWVRAGRG